MEFALRSAKECWEEYKSKHSFKSRAETEAVKKTFLSGYDKGLAAAFREQVEEKAIVLRTDKKVKEYHKDRGYGQKTVAQPKVADIMAHHRGFNMGYEAHKSQRLPSDAASSS